MRIIGNFRQNITNSNWILFFLISIAILGCEPYIQLQINNKMEYQLGIDTNNYLKIKADQVILDHVLIRVFYNLDKNVIINFDSVKVNFNNIKTEYMYLQGNRKGDIIRGKDFLQYEYINNEHNNLVDTIKISMKDALLLEGKSLINDELVIIRKKNTKAKTFFIYN